MNLAKEFDELLDLIQALLMSFLVKLGPFAVALMPALFSAYAIFYVFKDKAGPELAFGFAVVVGLALETVGIIATHTAVDLYNGMQQKVIDPGKFWLMVLLVPVYVLGVAGAVAFSGDAFDPLVKSLGVASPFLTCIVYIAVALARDLANIKQAQAAQSKHESANELVEQQHKRALELKKLEAEERRQLKELELRAMVEIERAKADAQPALPPALVPALPAQGGYICEDCQRNDFKTIQALNAHQRFCTAKSTNGKQ